MVEREKGGKGGEKGGEGGVWPWLRLLWRMWLVVCFFFIFFVFFLFDIPLPLPLLPFLPRTILLILCCFFLFLYDCYCSVLLCSCCSLLLVLLLFHVSVSCWCVLKGFLLVVFPLRLEMPRLERCDIHGPFSISPQIQNKCDARTELRHNAMFLRKCPPPGVVGCVVPAR